MCNAKGSRPLRRREKKRRRALEEESDPMWVEATVRKVSSTTLRKKKAQ